MNNIVFYQKIVNYKSLFRNLIIHALTRFNNHALISMDKMIFKHLLKDPMSATYVFGNMKDRKLQFLYSIKFSIKIVHIIRHICLK